MVVGCCTSVDLLSFFDMVVSGVVFGMLCYCDDVFLFWVISVDLMFLLVVFVCFGNLRLLVFYFWCFALFGVCLLRCAE